MLAIIPILIFILLAFLNFFILDRLRRFIAPTIFSGSMIMALSIFAYACLPQFNLPNLLLLLIALEFLAIWLIMGLELIQIYSYSTKPMSETDKIALGIWVISTVLLMLFINQVEKTLHGFIVLLGLIAITLCLIYLVVMVEWLYLTVKKKLSSPINATILLPSMCIQAMALLLNATFNVAIPIWLYQSLIILGCALYLLGLMILLSYELLDSNPAKSLTSTEDTLIYGGLAMIGLSVTSTQAFSDWVIIALWWSTWLAFFSVEVAELIKWVFRMRAREWSLITSYSAEQWLRYFSFGMFYAFNLIYYNHGYSQSYLPALFANYGQYLVALLLLIQLVVAVYHIKWESERRARQ